jgi:hypothetical protein
MAVVVDLNGIKDSLKTLFDNANTTTANPIDLSNGLVNGRVKKVLTVNPEQIPPQASFFPFVTSYIVSKSIEQKTIAVDQLNAKRQAEITIEIVGGVFNQNQISATKDPADTDINTLMENVEYVLRTNSNIDGKVLWQKATDVQYFTSTINATNHIRAGVLKVTAVVFY